MSQEVEPSLVSLCFLTARTNSLGAAPARLSSLNCCSIVSASKLAASAAAPMDEEPGPLSKAPPLFADGAAGGGGMMEADVDAIGARGMSCHSSPASDRFISPADPGSGADVILA
jgi:hypothetical protein